MPEIRPQELLKRMEDALARVPEPTARRLFDRMRTEYEAILAGADQSHVSEPPPLPAETVQEIGRSMRCNVPPLLRLLRVRDLVEPAGEGYALPHLRRIFVIRRKQVLRQQRRRDALRAGTSSSPTLSRPGGRDKGVTEGVTLAVSPENSRKSPDLWRVEGVTAGRDRGRDKGVTEGVTPHLPLAPPPLPPITPLSSTPLPLFPGFAPSERAAAAAPAVAPSSAPAVAGQEPKPRKRSAAPRPAVAGQEPKPRKRSAAPRPAVAGQEPKPRKRSAAPRPAADRGPGSPFVEFRDWWVKHAWPQAHGGELYPFENHDGVAVAAILKNPAFRRRDAEGRPLSDDAGEPLIDVEKAKRVAALYLREWEGNYPGHTLITLKKFLVRFVGRLADQAKGVQHHARNQRPKATAEARGEYASDLPVRGRQL